MAKAEIGGNMTDTDVVEAVDSLAIGEAGESVGGGQGACHQDRVSQHVDSWTLAKDSQGDITFSDLSELMCTS